MSNATIPAGTIPVRPMVRAEVPRSPRFHFNGSKSSLLAPKKNHCFTLMAIFSIDFMSSSVDFNSS